MIPPLIVDAALKNGLSIISITDHNQSANVKAVIEAAAGTDLTILPGMELQTAEEIHSLCIFDTLEQLETLQQMVDANLPNIENNIEFFGEQFIVDATGEFIKRDKRLLINSTKLSIEKACQAVLEMGGLFIPAHVNREAFGLISHLGFVPPELDINTLEISRHIAPKDAYIKFPQIKPYHLIQSGDVHYIDDFLGVNQFEIEKPTTAEIAKAFAEQDLRIHRIKTHQN